MTARTIDGYVLDCITEETVSYASEVTEYPVESGGKVADHVQNDAPTVTFTAIVSDSPIGDAAKARGANVVPSSEAKEFLLGLRAERRPFTFVGTTGTYDLMVFTSLEFPRDNETGKALRIEAELRQLTLAEVKRVVVRDVQLGHRTSTSVGGPKMWLCPDLEPIVDDESANRGKACREVIEINGAPHYKDNGELLTAGDAARFKVQNYRESSSGRIVLRKGETYYSEKNGRWMSADRFGDGRITTRAANQAQLRALGNKNFGVSGFTQDPRSRGSFVVDSGSVPSFEGMSWAPRAPE